MLEKLNTRKVWVCEFTTRHAMNEECTCSERYGVSITDFSRESRIMYPKKYTALSFHEKKCVAEQILRVNAD